MAIAPYVIGDWVGDFALLSVAGKQVKLSDTVGVPVVLLLCGDDPTQAAAAGAACASLAREYPTLAALNATVLAFGPGMAATAGSDRLGGPDELSPQGGGNAVWPRGVDLPFSMLIDADGEVAARYGAQRWRAVLLSPNGRVAKYYDAVDPDLLGEIVLADVAAMVNLEPARQILQQAPILLIPDVIPPEFCRKLIEVWEKQGNQDSGFMVNEGDKTVGKYDYSAKIRRDHFIPRGNELDKEARGWMGRHVAGEVFKAFNYEVTRRAAGTSGRTATTPPPPRRTGGMRRRFCSMTTTREAICAFLNMVRTSTGRRRGARRFLDAACCMRRRM
jgi:peroxiredoxin